MHFGGRGSFVFVMADQGGNNIGMREYRKGNWTVNETMVLIEAKEMDYERRMKRSNDNEVRGKPTELRWKWVEDYCWKKGCLRSQNQCNDKWDNLMRDYKKVREYHRKEGEGSYWEMEKNERKEKNLPSNMLRPIYDRLVEVVEKKGGGQTLAVAAAAGGSSGGGGGGGGGGSESDPPPSNVSNIVPYVMDRPMTSLLQHQLPSPIPAAIPLPLPPPPPPPPQMLPPSTTAPPLVTYAQPLPTVDSDTSEYSDSPAKRRRRGGNNGGDQGTAASENNTNEVGNAISKSASIIAEAIQASEEREERRHRDLISFHERRLKIEESKTEINRKGIDGLVDAINKLANSILALASHKNQSSAPK